MGIGTCYVCGLDVAERSSFVNAGPTDQNDPAKGRARRWVAADEDIHGWTPFLPAHPVCFAQGEGVAALVALVDESDCLWRRRLRST